DIRKRLGACQLKTESQIAVGEADHLSIQHRGAAPCGLEKIKCLGHWGRSHHLSLRIAMHQRGLHASGGGAGVAFIARWSVLLGSVGPSRLEGKQKLRGRREEEDRPLLLRARMRSSTRDLVQAAADLRLDGLDG